jgi:hypothetical protein
MTKPPRAIAFMTAAMSEPIMPLEPMPDPTPIQRAYHEAGHAIVAVCLGERLTRITIENVSESSGGMTSTESYQVWRLPFVGVILAGACAEAAYLGHDVITALRSSGYGDYLRACELIADPTAIIEPPIAWLSRPKVTAAAHALAAQLMERTSVDGDEADDLIWSNLGLDDDHELNDALMSLSGTNNTFNC